MIALIDAVSFYASCETVFNPKWRNKPLIVLSNNDGTVVAANPLAVSLGAKKFEPWFKVKELCQSRGVIACSSNFELYSSISLAMHNVIASYAPRGHVYSIDESFLDFSGCHNVITDFNALGHTIRRDVWQQTRIPVRAGFGKTLTLAKAASWAAKKMRDNKGVFAIETETQRKSVLNEMSTTDVWGIGSRLGRRLETMGINNAMQLANLEPAKARKIYSVDLERTVRELNGQPAKFWDEIRADKIQIYSTRSLGERIRDSESLVQALNQRASRAAEKLRAQQSLCRVMTFFASSSPFDKRPCSIKHTHSFPYPIDDTRALTAVIAAAMDKFFKPGIDYYRVGVGLVDLVDGKHLQGDLFEPKSYNPALMKALDGLNHRFGRQTCFFAGEGIESKWNMRRELLTPQYTTRWSEIPQIRC